MVPVVSIVGKSDSGKTTLIEKIVPLLNNRGYRTGSIKHDAHDFDIDHPGKDTYRHFQAGVQQVVIVSKQKIALVKRTATMQSLDDVLTTFFHDVDIVLTEGYKSEQKPKIEIYRSDIHKSPLCSELDNLVAFVSESKPDIDVPWFKPDQLNDLVNFIESRFLLSG